MPKRNKYGPSVVHKLNLSLVQKYNPVCVTNPECENNTGGYELASIISNFPPAVVVMLYPVKDVDVAIKNAEGMTSLTKALSLLTLEVSWLRRIQHRNRDINLQIPLAQTRFFRNHWTLLNIKIKTNGQVSVDLYDPKQSGILARLYWFFYLKRYVKNAVRQMFVNTNKVTYQGHFLNHQKFNNFEDCGRFIHLYTKKLLCQSSPEALEISNLDIEFNNCDNQVQEALTPIKEDISSKGKVKEIVVEDLGNFVDLHDSFKIITENLVEKTTASSDVIAVKQNDLKNASDKEVLKSITSNNDIITPKTIDEIREYFETSSVLEPLYEALVTQQRRANKLAVWGQDGYNPNVPKISFLRSQMQKTEAVIMGLIEKVKIKYELEFNIGELMNAVISNDADRLEQLRPDFLTLQQKLSAETPGFRC